jgi:broad specificity phosphatase PhoE
MTKKTITFVRHASGSHQKDQHTDLKCDDVTISTKKGLPRPYQDEFYEDTMLNTRGHEQATKLGLYLNSIGKSYKHVFCSPIRRVIETCDHIVKNKIVYINDNLIELNCTNNCNRKHNKIYLERFTFPRDNCYDLSNVNDEYSPDNILMIEKQMNNFQQKEIIQPIINKLEVDLWNIFEKVSDRNLKFVEKDEGRIKLKEAISFLRISNFIEDLLNRPELESDNIIVFTHGEWITFLKRLYLNINEVIGNCSYHILELENLDPNFICLIKEANELINKIYITILDILNKEPEDIKKLGASQYPDKYVIDENYKYNKYKSKLIKIKKKYDNLD